MKFFTPKRSLFSQIGTYLFLFGSIIVLTSSNKNVQHTQVKVHPIKHYPSHSLQYDSKKRIPLWTYEVLTDESVNQKVDRTNMHFQSDYSIHPLHRSQVKDYYQSGFDRGHMIPAADQQSSKESLEKTFLLSNICPQHASLNRGLWAKLERYIRTLVSKNQSIEVFTGPLFLSHPEGNRRYVKYQVIGENEVAVPTHFFKLIVTKHKKIAYIIPNQNVDSVKDLEDYIVPISTLEKASGLQFMF